MSNAQIVQAYRILSSKPIRSESTGTTSGVRAWIQLNSTQINKVLHNVTEADLKSAYPTYLQNNSKAPAELKIFMKILVHLRSKYPKGSVENEIFKLIANSLIGKMNSDKESCHAFKNGDLWANVIGGVSDLMRDVRDVSHGVWLCSYTDALFI